MEYYSEYTGEQIDEAVGKALSADAVPTPNSSHLVESGGVYGTLSNRNLLDNPFFTVNQRGSASYTTAGYTVDRWKLNVWQTTAQSVTVNTNGVRLSGTASGSNSCLLRQTLENGSQYAGKTVTLSVLVGSGMVIGNSVKAYIGTNANERFAALSLPMNGLYTKTVTLPNDITSLFIQIGQHASDAGSGNTSVEIRAVKLELGSISTLANDSPPNFTEELAKCQRYYWNSGFSSSNIGLFCGITNAGGNGFSILVPTPVTMRAQSPTVNAAVGWVRGNGSQITEYALGTNATGILNGFVYGISINKTSGFTPMQTYWVALTRLTVSCDL